MTNSTSGSTFGGKYILYQYNPSLPLAAVFVVLFLISVHYHMFQLYKKRTWYFIPFVIGGLFEQIGYVGRAWSAKQTPDWTTAPYIMQTLLLLLAPTLFSASIYMILGRIIRLTDGEHHSPIRANWLTKIFVLGDVLSFLAQSAGGGMLSQAKTKKDSDRGQYAIIGGLGIQILFFSVFIIVSAIFNVRQSKFPTRRSMQPDIPWQKFLGVLNVTSALILIRSFYRVVEYVQGNDGYLMSTEYFLYIFDAVMMFLVMVIFNIWHPGQIITKESMAARDPESQDSSYAMQDRPFVVSTSVPEYKR